MVSLPIQKEVVEGVDLPRAKVKTVEGIKIQERPWQSKSE